MDLMLIDVHLDACRANWKEAFFTFAKVSDQLLGVVGTFLGFFEFDGGFRGRLFFILHLSENIMTEMI